MCGGGGGGDQTVTNEPSDILRPYLLDFYGLSREMLDRGPESQFPLSGLAPRSQNTIDAETLALAGLGPSDASQAGIDALIASAAPSAGTQAGVQNIYNTLGASDLTLSGLQGTLDAAAPTATTLSGMDATIGAAGPSATTLAGMQGLLGAAQPSDLTLAGQQGALNAAGTQMDLGVSGADALLAALDPTSAQSQAIINPFIEQLQADILPSIGSTAVRQGAFGGSRQAVQEQRAAEGVADAATQALLRNQLSALDRLGVAQGGLLTGADTISGVGREQEAYDTLAAKTALDVGGMEEGYADKLAGALTTVGSQEQDILQGIADAQIGVGGALEGIDDQVTADLLRAGGIEEDIAGQSAATLLDAGGLVEDYTAGDIQTLSGVGRQQEGYGQAVLDQLALDYGFDDRALNALLDQFGSRITSGSAGNVQTASGGGGGGLASLVGLGTALYGLGAFGNR